MPIRSEGGCAMKNLLFSVLWALLFLLTNSLTISHVSSQTKSPSIEWEKTFCKNEDGFIGGIGQSVLQTRDNGYAVAGSAWMVGTEFYNCYLIKTNSEGDLVWDKTYGGDNAVYGASIDLTYGDGFIITGLFKNTKTEVAGEGDVYLLKTDGSGNLQWENHYGGDGWEIGNSVIEDSRFHYVVAGSRKLIEEDREHIYLLKTDLAGNLLWEKMYGGAENRSWGYSLSETTDNGYIIAGKIRPTIGDGSSAYIIKTDFNGNLLWERTIGTEAEGRSVQQTSDGGYIVGGTIRTTDNNFYLIKLNHLGDPLWQKYLGKNLAFSVKQTFDRGYVLAGIYGEEGDAKIVKTDVFGRFLWEKLIGVEEVLTDSLILSIHETNDRGYICVGEKYNKNHDEDWLYLLKLQHESISPLQLPGDCNQNGFLDISDTFCLIWKLFDSDIPPCGGMLQGPANVALLDSNGDRTVNISDIVFMLSHLFLGGRPHILGEKCVVIEGCQKSCFP